MSKLSYQLALVSLIFLLLEILNLMSYYLKHLFHVDRAYYCYVLVICHFPAIYLQR